MKVCNKCGKLKSDDEFYRAGSTIKGTCRDCMKILRDNKKKEYIHKSILTNEKSRLVEQLKKFEPFENEYSLISIQIKLIDKFLEKE